MTIDRIMNDYHLDKIDILKVDIEGADKEVFSNALSWIEKVDALIIELHERMKTGYAIAVFTVAQMVLIMNGLRARTYICQEKITC